MEVKILKEDKELIEVEIAGEGHTLCNVLRAELWNFDDTSFASYNLKHPLIGTPVLVLKIKKGKPRKLLLDSVDSIKVKTKELRSLLTKLH